eukprot:scaffold362330_cov13-Prasinocladus_malaysianus.AAC.1
MLFISLGSFAVLANCGSVDLLLTAIGSHQSPYFRVKADPKAMDLIISLCEFKRCTQSVRQQYVLHTIGI